MCYPFAGIEIAMACIVGTKERGFLNILILSELYIKSKALEDLPFEYIRPKSYIFLLCKEIIYNSAILQR